MLILRLCFFLLLLVFLPSEIKAQYGEITVSGFVKDKITEEPLPFAHLRWAEKGVVTNVDGEFTTSANIHNQYLIVSYMGYTTDSVLINASNIKLEIKLTPMTQQLNEVVVTTGIGLVKNLIKNITSNYQFKQQMWEAYYKEKLLDADGPHYLAEGILDIYFPGDQTKYDWQISTKRARKKTFRLDKDLIDLKISGNAHDMVRNLIWGEHSFLFEDRLGNFDFNYNGYTSLNGKDIFMVSFSPIAKREVAKGTLYIEEGSYALVKATYEMDTRKTKNWNSVSWEEEYAKDNGKWYFHRMAYTGTLYSGDKLLTIQADLVINNFKVVPMQPAMGLLMEPRDMFFDEVDYLGDDFWYGYSFMKLSSTELNVSNSN
jgi:hypothetical protein